MKTAVTNFLFAKLGLGMKIPYLRRIVLYANTVCNLKCPTCDIGLKNKKGIARNLGDSKYLSNGLLQKILADPVLRDRRLNFNFLMTEPLLSPNIFDLIKMVKDKGHTVLLTTNGYLLPEKAKGLIDAGLDRIQVSIDGPPELHDALKGMRGSFRKIIEGIDLLNNSSKIIIRVNCTVSNFNYKDLYELACILDKDVKIDRLKYQFLNFVSRQMADTQNEYYPIKQSVSSINEKIIFDEIDSSKLSKQIMMLKSAQFKNIADIRVIPNISSPEDIEKWFNINAAPIKGNNKCFIPFYQIAVKPDGNVVWHMRCYNYTIGNINREGLKDIFYEGKKAKYFREVLKKSSFCMPACNRCCGVTTHRDFSHKRSIHPELS